MRIFSDGGKGAQQNDAQVLLQQGRQVVHCLKVLLQQVLVVGVGMTKSVKNLFRWTMWK